MQQQQQQQSSQQSSTQPPLRRQRYDPAVLQTRRRFGQSWVPRGTGPQIQAAAGVLDDTHTGQHSNDVGSSGTIDDQDMSVYGANYVQNPDQDSDMLDWDE